MLGAGKRSLLRDGDPELTQEEGPAFVVRRASRSPHRESRVAGQGEPPVAAPRPGFRIPVA